MPAIGKWDNSDEKIRLHTLVTMFEYMYFSLALSPVFLVILVD
jgi:hypothetical protein